jgi:hypothetical protein
MSQMTQSCPGTTPPSTAVADNIEKNKGIIDTLGINKCQTTASSSSSEFSFSSGGMVGMLAGGAQGGGRSSEEAKSTVGCGALNVLLQSHINTVNTVTCILNDNISSASTTTTAINTIDFAGNITMNCGKGGFNLSQDSDVTMTIVNSINQTIMAKVTNAVQNGVAAFTAGVAAGGTGPAYGPDGQGTQTIQTINDQNVNNNTLDNLTKVVNTIINTTIAGNKLTIGSTGGSLNISGDSCTISQRTHVNIIASNIVSTAFETALKGVNLATIMPVPPALSDKKSYTAVIVVVVLILLVGGAAVYYLYFMKKPTDIIGKPIVPIGKPIVPTTLDKPLVPTTVGKPALSFRKAIKSVTA